MRILSIAVRNLASLAGTQPVVRFGEGGLASGLIAVTGPTGAGKSTVLDALCLGLYGATPRLPTGRSEDLNPRNILTRDATDGFAEVEFEGAAGGRFRSRWEIGVSRNGVVQPPQMDLVDLDHEEHLERGVRGVRQRVTELLGLDREQFIGVALLAQGSFSAFLGGEADQRGQLLERLTGASRFADLGRAAHLDAQRRRETVEGLRQRLGEHRLLDAPARDAAERQASAAQATEREATAAEHAAREHQARVDELAMAEAQLASEQARLDAAGDAHAAAGSERERLARAERVEPVRSALVVLREREGSLQRARAVVEASDARREAVEHAVPRALDDVAVRAGHLSGAFDALGLARDALRWSEPASSGRVAELRGQLAALQRVLDSRQASASALEDARAAQAPAAARVDEAATQVESSAARRAGRESEVEAARAERDRQRERTGGSAGVGERLERRRRIVELLEESDACVLAVDEGARRADAAELAGADATARAAQLEATVDGLAAGLEIAERLLALRLSEAGLVEHRHVLIEGEPCPLCEQVVDVLPGEPPAPDPSGQDPSAPGPLVAARDDVARLRAELEETRERARSEREAVRRLATERALALEERARAEARLQALGERWSTWREDDPALPPVLKDCTPARAVELVEETEADRRLLAVADSAVESADAALVAARGEEATSREALLVAEREVATLAERTRVLATTLEQAEVDAGRARATIVDSLAALADDLGRAPPGLDVAQAWLDEQADANRRWQALDELRGEWREVTVERLEEAARQLAGAGRTTDPGGAIVPAPSVPDATALAASNTALAQALSRSGEAARESAKAAEDLERDRRIVADREEATSASRAALLGAASQLDLPTEAAVEAALMPADELAALRQRMRDVGEALAAARASVQTASDRAGAARGRFAPGSAPDADALPAARDEAGARLGEASRAVAVARSALEEARQVLAVDDRSRAAAGRLTEAIGQAEADFQRAENLRLCIGSATGHRFRDIAQQLTLDVLASYANRRLRRFAPRYALRRRQGLELEVVDRDLADEVRPVNTLSGGERFLVSLGLALALADLKRGRASVRSVFIDEGFGSLDEASLDRALAALEAVQDDLGAQLVVISHVGELHNRWADHVEVRRVSRTRSWLVLPGGPAQPTRDEASVGVQWLPNIDLDAAVDWLAAEGEPRTRRAIAEAIGLQADDKRLAGALRDDARIERSGQRYTLAADAGPDFALVPDAP